MKALSALLVAWFAGAVAWAQVPTSNVLYRVLRIKTATSTGSAFTIEVDGKQYLITARHLLTGFGSEGEIELWIGGQVEPGPGRAPSIPSKEVVDIAALDLGQAGHDHLPLKPSSGGLTLGQQVYFLGYPYGLGTSRSAPAPARIRRDPLPEERDRLGAWTIGTRRRASSISTARTTPAFPGGPSCSGMPRAAASAWPESCADTGTRRCRCSGRRTSTIPRRGPTTTCTRGPTQGSSSATTSGISSMRSAPRASPPIPPIP